MVDPEALNALIAKGGISARSAKQLREANVAEPAEAGAKPRGHGAAREADVVVSEV